MPKTGSVANSGTYLCFALVRAWDAGPTSPLLYYVTPLFGSDTSFCFSRYMEYVCIGNLPKWEGRQGAQTLNLRDEMRLFMLRGETVSITRTGLCIYRKKKNRPCVYLQGTGVNIYTVRSLNFLQVAL